MRFSAFFAAVVLGLATLGGGFGAQAAGVTQGASAVPELAKTLPVATYGGEKVDILQARYYHRHYYRGHHYGYHHLHYYRGYHYGYHHRHYYRGYRYSYHHRHYYRRYR
jgi:hypothetical protein